VVKLLRDIVDLEHLRIPEERLVPHQQILLHMYKLYIKGVYRVRVSGGLSPVFTGKPLSTTF
jgi:hypothetical protein